MLNWILMTLHIVDAPVSILYTEKAVVIGSLHVFFPMMVLPLASALGKIDPNLEDAARMLGAPWWKVFLRVTLPLSLPGFVAGFTLVFSLTAGSFVIPAILGGASALMLGNLIEQQIFVVYDWPFGAAIALVLVGVVLAVNGVSMCSCAGAPAWPVDTVLNLFNLPFNDLLFQAQQVHRQNFDPTEIELATLLSIKTGGCPEDCGYCPQAARYNTGVTAQKILPLDTVQDAARQAKAHGATRFCMGAACANHKGPRPRARRGNGARSKGHRYRDLRHPRDAWRQAERLKHAGLDYYNHNLDTAPELYGDIITTRDYQDRLDTLENVRGAGINVCCGGIVGMEESRQQRAGLVAQLANMTPYPESVPIHNLVQVEGTPLYGSEALDLFEFVRTIAVARVTMPKARVRLSAGRRQMGEAFQALCFLAGANSIFYGDKLLTTGNPDVEDDRALLDKLGIHTR
jgi:biotin synthase